MSNPIKLSFDPHAANRATQQLGEDIHRSLEAAQPALRELSERTIRAADAIARSVNEHLGPTIRAIRDVQISIGPKQNNSRST